MGDTATSSEANSTAAVAPNAVVTDTSSPSVDGLATSTFEEKKTTPVDSSTATSDALDPALLSQTKTANLPIMESTTPTQLATPQLFRSILSPTLMPQQSIWKSISEAARTLAQHTEQGIAALIGRHSLRLAPFSAETLNAASFVYVLGKRITVQNDQLSPSQPCSSPLKSEREAAVYSKFLSEVSKIANFTYRSNFTLVSKPANDSGLPANTFSNDCGWGCMIRVGQTLLFNSLVRLAFQNSPQYPAHPATSLPAISSLAKHFVDHSEAMFSVHSIVEQGEILGTPCGRWFGPNIMAHAFRLICEKHKGVIFQPETELPETVAKKVPPRLHVIVSQDSMVCSTQVESVLLKNQGDWVLLLVPLRLGIETLHQAYWPFILEYFKCPYASGIAGGQTNSAIYFFGTLCPDNCLLGLDPHFVQPALTSASEFDSLYSKSHTGTLPLSSVDPSLCLSFTFSCPEHFENFKQWHSNLEKNSISVPVALVTLSPSESSSAVNTKCLISDDEDVPGERTKK